MFYMHFATDHGFPSLCWESLNKVGPPRSTNQSVVFRHVAAGPRSGRFTFAWVGRAPSSTQWKPLLPMVTTSPQHQSKCTARSLWCTPMLATGESKKALRWRAGDRVPS